jgi:hypothetical protein
MKKIIPNAAPYKKKENIKNLIIFHETRIKVIKYPCLFKQAENIVAIPVHAEAIKSKQ